MHRGLTAASSLMGCAVLVMSLLLLTSGRSEARSHVAHVCTPPDRLFIRRAAEGMLGLDFRAGTSWGENAELEAEALSAVSLVRATQPLDPTLRQARSLFGGLLVEYAASLRAAPASEAATRHGQRSRRYAATVRGLLAQNEAALDALGCPIETLL